MKFKYALLLAASAVFSSPSFAEAPKLEGFDLSLAKAPPFPVPALYDTPENLSSLPVGSLIRKEAVEAPEGAQAWRVLYVSERWDGTRVPASGLVIAPKTTADKAVRPVVAWDHGTTGAARGCAPSLAPNPAVELAQRGEFMIDIGIPYLKDWLAKGYAVVAPDYAGLGSDAVHRYGEGVGEGRDTHNLLRAARSIVEAAIGEDSAVLGWSQGGGAALFTGEIGAAYAPDNKIKTIVALAPGSRALRPVENDFFKSGSPFRLLIGQSFIDAYQLNPDVFSEDGKKLLEEARKTCVVGLYAASAAVEAPIMKSSPREERDWLDALRRNDAGYMKSQAPVLVIQGTADTIVAPDDSKAYVARAAQVGTDISIKWVENAGHRDLFEPEKDLILKTISDALERN